MSSSITNVWWFISVVVLVFSLVLVLTGAFTTYFGSGKSRVIGVVLLVVGLVIGILYVLAGSHYLNIIDVPIRTIIIETTLYLVATVIGAVIGIGVFLGAIMKA